MAEQNKRLIEKRKFIRLLFETDIKYKIEGDKSGGLETAKCNNISPDGLCLTLRKPVEKGALLRVEIAIKALPPFSIKGEAIWVKSAGAEGKEVTVGIKILDIENDERNRFLLEMCDKMVNALAKKYPDIKF